MGGMSLRVRLLQTVKAMLVLLSLSCGLPLNSQVVVAQGSVAAAVAVVKTDDFHADVQNFLEKELTAHLAAISTMDPPPDRVLGVPTTGEFSWGTFMRSLAAYADTSGKR